MAEGGWGSGTWGEAAWGGSVYDRSTPETVSALDSETAAVTFQSEVAETASGVDTNSAAHIDHVVAVDVDED